MFIQKKIVVPPKLSLSNTKQRGCNGYLRGSDTAPVVAEAPTSGLGTAGLGAWCVAGELVTDAEVSEPAEVPPAIGFDTPADNSPRSEAIKINEMSQYTRSKFDLLS